MRGNVVEKKIYRARCTQAILGPNPTSTSWLSCDLGKFFNLSEPQFPHPHPVKQEDGRFRSAGLG